MSNNHWQQENNKKQRRVDKSTLEYAKSLAKEGYDYAKRHGNKWVGLKVVSHLYTTMFYYVEGKGRLTGMNVRYRDRLLRTEQMIKLEKPNE